MGSPPLADFTYKNNSIVRVTIATARRTRKIKIVWQNIKKKQQQKTLKTREKNLKRQPNNMCCVLAGPVSQVGECMGCWVSFQLLLSSDSLLLLLLCAHNFRRIFYLILYWKSHADIFFLNDKKKTLFYQKKCNFIVKL